MYIITIISFLSSSDGTDLRQPNFNTSIPLKSWSNTYNLRSFITIFNCGWNETNFSDSDQTMACSWRSVRLFDQSFRPFYLTNQINRLLQMHAHVHVASRPGGIWATKLLLLFLSWFRFFLSFGISCIFFCSVRNLSSRKLRRSNKHIIIISVIKTEHFASKYSNSDCLNKHPKTKRLRISIKKTSQRQTNDFIWFLNLTIRSIKMIDRMLLYPFYCYFMPLWYDANRYGNLCRNINTHTLVQTYGDTLSSAQKSYCECQPN